MATPGGCFPAQLTSTAASAPRGAQLPEAGRAGDNAGDGSRDRHRHLPMAAPKAQPSIRRSLAQPSRPCRHAQQESRYEPGWASLCRCPNISSEGCVLKVHHSVMLPSTTWCCHGGLSAPTVLTGVALWLALALVPLYTHLGLLQCHFPLFPLTLCLLLAIGVSHQSPRPWLCPPRVPSGNSGHGVHLWQS